MCGRLTLRSDPDVIAEHFRVDAVPGFSARYNVAPSQPLLAIVEGSEPDSREPRIFQWGLVPSWSKDGKGWINARIETAGTKPAFRSAFSSRRCLIPADGYYEWSRNPDGTKTPYFFTFRDDRVFAFCGIWDRWHAADGSEIETCAILTTHPSPLAASVHHRMPVVTSPDNYDLWLDVSDRSKNHRETLTHIFETPFEDPAFTSFPVSKVVNNPRNDDPRCIEPAVS